MALLFTEGFDWSTSAGDYTGTGKWLDANSGAFGNTTATLRFGASSGNYYTGTGRTDFLRRAIGSNLQSGVLGIAMRLATSANYKMNVFVLFDTTSNVQMGVLLNTDGTFSIFRGTHSNILGTSTFAITGNAWHYIELKWKIADSISSGDVVLYADGTAIITVTAASDTQNTANAYATHYCFSGNSPSITSGGSGTFFFDDHYLLDLTGSSPLNAPLGNARIQTLFPNANGTNSQFVGSDGNSVNNFQQVDDASYSASDYNDGTTLNHKDTYGFTDTVATTSVVHAVAVNIVALKTDTDPRSVAPVVRHSGTDYDGTNIALTATAVSSQQIMTTNPGTSSGWTKSDVDSAEFGVKVTV